MDLQMLAVILLLTFLDKGSSFVLKRNETDLKSQIIGGYKIREGHIPYHVRLQCNGQYFCGGALVTNRHVLTAAHCAQNDCKITVTAGTIYRKWGGLEIPVKTRYVPANYFSYNRQFLVKDDIAVMELLRPFQISNDIAPIKLASAPPINNENIIITGFGRISPYTQQLSDSLKIFNTTLLDYDHCNYINPVPIDKSDFCDVPVPGTGSCMGDSGSPVVNEEGKLIGVVSRQFSRPGAQVKCAQNVPTVYTSVYHHLNFIYKIFKQ